MMLPIYTARKHEIQNAVFHQQNVVECWSFACLRYKVLLDIQNKTDEIYIYLLLIPTV